MRPGAAAQLDHYFLAWLVLQGENVLNGQGADRIDLLGRQVGAAEDISIYFQSGAEVTGQGRAPETDVELADALVAIQAEVIQRQAEFPARALAGPARDHLGEDCGHAKALRRIINATGRHQEI